MCQEGSDGSEVCGRLTSNPRGVKTGRPLFTSARVLGESKPLNVVTECPGSFRNMNDNVKRISFFLC